MPTIAGKLITQHGFRGTFSTWANDHMNVAHDLVERCLAHRVGNEGAAAHYHSNNKLERRRAVMQDWASFCSQPWAPAEVVIPLRRKERA
jgi:integrase